MCVCVCVFAFVVANGNIYYGTQHEIAHVHAEKIQFVIKSLLKLSLHWSVIEKKACAYVYSARIVFRFVVASKNV